VIGNADENRIQQTTFTWGRQSGLVKQKDRVREAEFHQIGNVITPYAQRIRIGTRDCSPPWIHDPKIILQAQTLRPM